MALSDENSDEYSTCESLDLNDDNAEQLENAPFEISMSSKLASLTPKQEETLLNPNLVRTTEKKTFLANVKNSTEKPESSHKYRIHKLKPYHSKKPRSSRSPRKPDEMSDEELTEETLRNDYDLPPLRNNEDTDKDEEYSDDPPTNQIAKGESFNWQNSTLSNKDNSESDEHWSDDSEVTPGFRSQQTSTDDLYKLQEVVLVYHKTAIDPPKGRINRVISQMYPCLQTIPEEPEKPAELEKRGKPEKPEEPEEPENPEEPEKPHGPQLRRPGDEKRIAEEVQKKKREIEELKDLNDREFQIYEETRKPAVFYAIRPPPKTNTWIRIVLFLILFALLVMTAAALWVKQVRSMIPEIPKEPPMTTKWWQYFCNPAQVLYIFK